MMTITFTNILLVVGLSATLFGDPTKPLDLVNSKWISPVTDDCYAKLCFNSDRTVVLNRCDEDEDDWSFEVGYKIVDGKIEIEAYERQNMDPKSKLILFEDHGVLRQYEAQVNNFPKVYMQVPKGKCE